MAKSSTMLDSLCQVFRGGGSGTITGVLPCNQSQSPESSTFAVITINIASDAACRMTLSTVGGTPSQPRGQPGHGVATLQHVDHDQGDEGQADDHVDVDRYVPVVEGDQRAGKAHEQRNVDGQAGPCPGAADGPGPRRSVDAHSIGCRVTPDGLRPASTQPTAVAMRGMPIRMKRRLSTGMLPRDAIPPLSEFDRRKPMTPT